ncbi:type VII secretion target [Actinokineospora auranticolor]|uniref:Excreted virulence factor EspC (Type VII ESX diderm) n=1 Tax=Actinokineospora auranticolor TaxID=155976 RepID=A0A2S6GEL1_9PSEU|nr:type VII secretion target [Actinokineospora auranticolor]PPK63668.1 excreted virulence factor EspC (type VII ESX diderm) [Actinokineospora auranticolor]
MAENMDVAAGELTGHAGNLGGIEERLGTALSAARQVSMDNDAYGVLGRPFAWLLDPFESLGADMISAGIDTLGNDIDNLKGAATGYGTTEDTNTAMYGGGA